MLLLFVFAYFVYRLAYKYDKNPWLWAFAGALTYVAIFFSLWIILVILFLLDISIGISPEYPVFRYGMIVISSGLFYLIYRYFNNKWEREDTRFSINNPIDEIEKKQF